MIKLGIFKVTGPSMQPVYKQGDFVIAFRTVLSNFDKGDVVVINHKHFGKIIKRIKSIDEAGDFLVAGDNTIMSTDTMTIGPVAIEHILGRVMIKVAAPKIKR